MNLINKNILMKSSLAKWHLNHPEMYNSFDSGDTECIEDYDIDTQLFLMCLIGEPVRGFIKMEGNEGSWGVIFYAAGLSTFMFVDPKDFKVVN